MRILMVSKACVVGIYQRKLEEIARLPGLDLTAIVPPVWNDSSGPIRLERAYTEGYRLVVEPLRFNGRFHLHYFPALGKHIRELRPEIVHIDEEPYNLAAWHALMLARGVGAKTLFFSWQNVRRQYPFPFSAGERWTLRHVDHAIMGTHSAAELWRAKGYRGPLTVIPQFGVDPAIFHPPDRQPKEPVIGYIGRLVPEKGVDVLICAAGRAGALRLRIIGQGPERTKLERLARAHGVPVEFTGQVPSMQMPDLYRELTALVLPSRTLRTWKEQFGRVLVEAMACGVPVIGSDSGAIPEVIGDAGLIFPEGDSEALASQLAALLDDPSLRAQLGARGRVRVTENYTHTQVAARTVEVYRAMLGEANAGIHGLSGDPANGRMTAWDR